MSILLLDTSSKKIEFSFWRNGNLILKEELPPDENADMLIYYLKKTFVERMIKLQDIRYVSLSNGPGSFTGLRIGSAIAKGICYCTGSKLIEINTLDLIANKYNGSSKVISMIFSNTRTSEFYYCEYEKINGKLARLSEYKKDIFSEIPAEGFIYVVNDNSIGNFINFIKGSDKDIKDLSDPANSVSQLELTMEYIEGGEFSNYKNSEPFYMNDFIPKI